MCYINFLMICLLLFGSFNPIIAPRSSDGTRILTHIHYYTLASDSNQCLVVYSSHPTGPHILLLFTKFELHHEQPIERPLHQFSKRYYLKSRKPCTTNFKISSKNLKFKKIILEISIQATADIDSYLGQILYVIKSDVQDGLHKLSDKQLNIALQVNFDTNGDEFIPPTVNDYQKTVDALKTVDDQGTSVCVISTNSIGFVFNPIYKERVKPRGVISYILYKYTTSSEEHIEGEYKAWDCSANAYHTSGGTFVKDQFDFKAELETLVLSYDYNTREYVQTQFEIPSDKIVEFPNSQGLSAASFVFFMNNDSERLECPSKDIVYTYKTSEKAVYWAEKIQETDENGLEWKELWPVNPNELCPVKE